MLRPNTYLTQGTANSDKLNLARPQIAVLSNVELCASLTDLAPQPRRGKTILAQVAGRFKPQWGGKALSSLRDFDSIMFQSHQEEAQNVLAFRIN